MQWQNFDYYHKPVVSHYYIKRACEPLHVQMDLIDHAVTVINCRLQAQPGLQVTARVFDLNAKLLWEHSAKLEAPPNAYREAFRIEGLPNLAPFVFVKLELKDSSGHVVSDNFYWLRGQGTPDYRMLQTLPLAKLDATSRVEDRGVEKLVRVKVANPSPNLAFFVQLALTKAVNGEEILPVFWDDNYFSLLPGESRQITARISSEDSGPATPQLEVGGWNIETDFECRSVEVSPGSPKAGEQIRIAATVMDTFLDGSRVTAYWDGASAASNFAWARDGKAQTLELVTKAPKAGRHELAVGRRRLVIDVRPE